MKATRVFPVAAMLLAGCVTVGSDYHLPEAAIVRTGSAQGPFSASQTGVTTTESPPGRWWRLFDDPVLDAWIDKALAANTDLRVAESNLLRSHALLDEARAADELDPVLDVQTSYGQQSAEAFLQRVQPPTRQTYNAGLTVSYDLDLFGRIRRGVEAANADDEAVAAARDLVRIHVAAEAAQAYAEVCNSGRQREVLARLVDLHREHVRLIGIAIAAGRASPLEQAQQQTVLDSARARLPHIDARQQNAAFRLATLAGVPPAEFDRSLLECRHTLRLPARLPVGDGRALLARRPDVRAAERRLAADTARIGVATAGLYPEIRLGASVGSTGGVLDLLSPLTNRYAIGPTIRWNLRQDPARARIAQAEAQVQASLAVFDGVVLKALRDVESSLSRYAADLDRLAALGTAWQSASQVERQTVGLWQAGRLGRFATLDAERSQILAEDAVTSTEADTNADQIALFLALGGGWMQATDDAADGR